MISTYKLCRLMIVPILVMFSLICACSSSDDESLDPSLKNIEIVGYTLNPAFDPDITDYTVEVPSVQTEIDVTAPRKHENHYVRMYSNDEYINYTDFTDGQCKWKVSISSGQTTLKIYSSVSNKAGTESVTREYLIVLTQLDGSSALKAVTLTDMSFIDDIVPGSTTVNVTVIGVLNPMITITPVSPNAKILLDGVAVTPALPYGPLTLTNNGTREVKLMITSADGLSQTEYTLKLRHSDYNNLFNSWTASPGSKMENFNCYYSAISSTDGSRIYGNVYNSTNNYTFYRTTDGGATWTSLSRTFSYRSLSCNSLGNNIVGLKESTIMISKNSGDTWTEVDPDPSSTDRLEGIKYSQAGLSIIAWSNNSLYLSTDNGTSWKKISMTIGEDFNFIAKVAISLDNKIIVCMPQHGIPRISKDGGNTWNILSTSLENYNLCGLDMSLDGNTILISGSSKVLVSYNGGGSFVSIDDSAHFAYHVSVWGAGSGLGYLKSKMYESPGATYEFIYSLDHGVTWKTQSLPFGTNDVSHLRVADNNTLTISRNTGGALWRSTDMGKSWRHIGPAPTFNWAGISSSSDGRNYAAVDVSGAVYCSSDYGNSWSLIGKKGKTSGIVFSDDGSKWDVAEDPCIAICASSDLAKRSRIRTNNNIETYDVSTNQWSEKTNSGARNWTGIAMTADGGLIAACVNGGYIYTSTNYGSTWVERQTAQVRNWRSISTTADGSVLMAVANNDYIYLSYDKGASWSQLVSSGSRDWTTGVIADNGKVLLAVAGTSLYCSSDEGGTWNLMSGAGSKNWKSLTISSDGAKAAAIVSGSNDIWYCR